MKLVILSFLSVGLSCSVAAQVFEIGIIDYYGLKKVKEDAVASCLPFTSGAKIDIEKIRKGPFVECAEKLKGIEGADLNLVCCDSRGKMIAFVGIAESRLPTPPMREFSSDIQLPADVLQKYDTFMIKLFEGVEKGMGNEDNTEGHALMKYPPARPYQEAFIRYANEQFVLLSKVLAESKDSRQREAASWVIAYYKDKQAVADVLMTAVNDPDENVRNNVIRGISVIADYSLKKKIPITIAPDPFILMMNSLTWTDRNKSASVLMSLTARKDQQLLDRLRLEALDPLKDMALWKSSGHSMPGFIILARIGGWSDGQMMDGMKQDRATVVRQLLSEIRKRK